MSMSDIRKYISIIETGSIAPKKTINLKNGIIRSEIDISSEQLENLKPKLTRDDFGSDVRYNNYLEVKKMLSNLTVKPDDDVVILENEKTEKFYNLKEWLKTAKKYKMTVSSGYMSGALDKSAKIYYANGENGGGYFYLYSKDNGEGSITISNN